MLSSLRRKMILANYESWKRRSLTKSQFQNGIEVNIRWKKKILIAYCCMVSFENKIRFWIPPFLAPYRWEWPCLDLPGSGWIACVLALGCSAQQCTNGAWCPRRTVYAEQKSKRLSTYLLCVPYTTLQMGHLVWRLSMMTLWTGFKQKNCAFDNKIGPNEEEYPLLFEHLFSCMNLYAPYLSHHSNTKRFC